MDDMGRPSTTTPKSLPVSLRLPPEVKAAAELAAKDDTRSLSSFLEKLLTDHLKAEGYLGGTATGTLSNEPHLATAETPAAKKP
jgi:hypothetical protein